MEVEERYRRLRAQVPSTAIGTEITDYLTHLRIERGSSENTLSSYRNDLLRYGAFLLEQQIDEPRQIEEALIAEFVRTVSTGEDGGSAMAERSLARILASVRGLHKYWAQEGRTGHDPAAHVTAPKPTETLPKALSVEQVGRLLEAPSPATSLGLRDRALLEFLYATGARITEAVSLDVDDVYVISQRADAGVPGHPEAEEDTGASDQLVVVRVTGKGDKQRLVPVGTYAQQAISNYLTAGRPELADAVARSSAKTRRAPSPALFLNKLGGRLSRQSAWTNLQRHAEAAGIEQEVSPHTLRHSCATHMLDGGAGIRMVQEMLGHASVTTTQIYTKVTAEALQEQYASAHTRAR